MMSPTKQQISKTSQFFFSNWNYKTFRICRVFEQLSCSTGWQVWPSANMAKVTFCRTWFFIKIWVLGP